VRLLFDTHIVLAISERKRFAKHIELAPIVSGNHQRYVSAASLWEIAIKQRIGKLQLAVAIEDLHVFLETIGIAILAIDAWHAIAELQTKPATRDPFDRLLLAQCQVEGLRLVTFDRDLASHPLAWHAPA